MYIMYLDVDASLTAGTSCRSCLIDFALCNTVARNTVQHSVLRYRSPLQGLHSLVIRWELSIIVAARMSISLMVRSKMALNMLQRSLRFSSWC